MALKVYCSCGKIMAQMTQQQDSLLPHLASSLLQQGISLRAMLLGNQGWSDNLFLGGILETTSLALDLGMAHLYLRSTRPGQPLNCFVIQALTQFLSDMAYLGFNYIKTLHSSSFIFAILA
jgi:hypothetical protein